MKKLKYLFLLLFGLQSTAQTWIWFPGDFEKWLGNQMNNRRTERGTDVPIQWKSYNHEPLMIYIKNINLNESEEIEIFVEGEQYNISLGIKRILNGNKDGYTNKLSLPVGKNEFKIKVVNYCIPYTNPVLLDYLPSLTSHHAKKSEV